MPSVGGARVRRFIVTGALASALVAGGAGVAITGTHSSTPSSTTPTTAATHCPTRSSTTG
jgi:hypothetical protein